MRHNKTLAKLGVKESHRRALLRNLASSLLTHGRIHTTHSRARALRPVVEKLIGLGKRGPTDLHAGRLAARDIHDKELQRKLFGELAELYRTRQGGYTRVLKTTWRPGDRADMALIELVDVIPDHHHHDHEHSAAPAAH